MLKRKKALIIDPSPIFRRTLKEVIQNSETHVDIREANDADQARSILKKDLPDVVFFDIALPRNNGIEFIASIRGWVPKSRIVVLTSHDSAEYEKASLQNGADYFISKDRSGGLQLINVIHDATRKNGDG